MPEQAQPEEPWVPRSCPSCGLQVPSRMGQDSASYARTAITRGGDGCSTLGDVVHDRAISPTSSHFPVIGKKQSVGAASGQQSVDAGH
jgi:hypothetical protein